MMTKYNILITGVAGFLGSHLSEKLLDLGHKVIGVDNMIGGYEDNIHKDIEFHNLDCSDFSKVKKKIKKIMNFIKDEDNLGRIFIIAVRYP